MKTPVGLRAIPMPAASGGVTVEVFALTDVGRSREHNEDAYIVADLASGKVLEFDAIRRTPVGNQGLLFMVADGMGGAAAGELASATAVDVVLRHLRDFWSPRLSAAADQFVGALEEATEMANGVIFQYASERPELRGMGTTATVAGLLGDTLYLAQVGDSRAYLIRDGVARQITKDQSLMQKLIEAGEISEEEAEQSERRNIILQALGPEAAIKIDLTHQRLHQGDALILCSDGLSGLVRGDEIARTVQEEPDLESVCRRLVKMANSMGGPDNITVVAARFDGDRLAAPGEDDEVKHRIYAIPGRAPSPTGTLDDMMRAKSEQMFQTTPPALPPAVQAARQETSAIVRGILAAAAVVLGGYMAWRLMQLL